MAEDHSSQQSSKRNNDRERSAEDDIDRLLAMDAGRGDASSFETLVKRHTNRLLRFLGRRARTGHDAEDLVQETWVRTYRFMNRYDPSYSFQAWLFSIGANLAASRARMRHEMTVLDDEVGARHEAETAVTDTPSTLMQAGEDRASIWQTADRILPEAQREALWLFYAEQFSVREVASVMGITAINVKVLLFRARTRMAAELRAGKPGHERTSTTCMNSIGALE